MNIGIDMDATLIDIEPAWARYFDAYREEHEHLREYSTAQSWDHPVQLCVRCYRDCCERTDVLAEGTLMPGAADALARLAAHHALYLISHRDEGLRFAATRLLKDRGVYSHFTGCAWSFAPKADTCRSLGISMMLDDGPANIIALSESSTLPVIFDQPYNRHLEGVRVRSWAEFEAFVSDCMRSGVVQ